MTDKNQGQAETVANRYIRDQVRDEVNVSKGQNSSASKQVNDLPLNETINNALQINTEHKRT